MKRGLIMVALSALVLMFAPSVKGYAHSGETVLSVSISRR